MNLLVCINEIDGPSCHHKKVRESRSSVHDVVMKYRLCHSALASAIQAHDFKSICSKSLPIILQGMCNDWPALKEWKNYSGMKSRVSDEHLRVSVEVGGDYMSSSMRMTEMNFHKLLDIFQDRQKVLESFNIRSSSQTKTSGKHMYVAQYDLSNIPELVPDVSIPTLLSDISETDKLYAVKFWLGGPDGTSSPCHFDPYENLLCQVLGSKHVLLFPPQERAFLYPYHNTTQRNTSQIPFSKLLPSILSQSQPNQHAIVNSLTSDSITQEFSSKDEVVANVFDKFTGLTHATATLATLQPGDALYIPRGWWHFCSAPAASCSVNFWWA